ncbi:hypothetical protein [Nocardia mangyaensis]|uniref:hypothetical protein n=1 Tax=Nocardia mangyaensis TaxID=2213200 RepID=UPI00267500C6|nr:hypothetical protein [Nocardia mangyaensis]MDO3646143.1 hypothetical protein [Nocardia mangyaensis]
MTQSDDPHPPTPAAQVDQSPDASTTPAAVTRAEIPANHSWGQSLDDLVGTLEGLRAVGLLEHVPAAPTTEAIDPAVTGLSGEL